MLQSVHTSVFCFLSFLPVILRFVHAGGYRHEQLPSNVSWSTRRHSRVEIGSCNWTSLGWSPYVAHWGRHISSSVKRGNRIFRILYPVNLVAHEAHTHTHTLQASAACVFPLHWYLEQDDLECFPVLPGEMTPIPTNQTCVNWNRNRALWML